ncbi:hypothetical protein EGN72_11535 [Pseudorhodobacter sp. E13]|uniref:hypothetical protein n=1 Tax=Pseudorhodobacter sp. E13 TaxID=2487931 RepID=UPI000F8DC3D3|nr:hypothetical protein [Pseudorhodobacter sp. E13]RUS60078.1 hypothetical protein EGN72_11535 [Pseudorhodobacter sp. E13]
MRFLLPLLALCASPTLADPPVIEAATATPSGAAWRFDVTLRHPDTGWDHYADAWEVLAPDGTSLGLRVLLHPHENEQPFTRSLNGVAIPAGLDHVMIRARCLVDGWADTALRVDLPR